MKENGLVAMQNFRHQIDDLVINKAEYEENQIYLMSPQIGTNRRYKAR